MIIIIYKSKLSLNVQCFVYLYFPPKMYKKKKKEKKKLQYYRIYDELLLFQ